MGLFKPAWMNKSEEKAVKAVEALTDQDKLARAVRETTSLKVRKLAAEKVTDQKILADLAVNYNNIFVHEIVAAKLLDERILSYIAINSAYMGVREIAVEKLTDQEILAHIIKHEKVKTIRLKAAEKLTDQSLVQEVYAEIAKTAEYWTQSVDAACARAVQNLTDQRLLADVAIHTQDGRRIGCMAVEKLTDQALLVEVAKNAKDGAMLMLSVKMNAVKKIRDSKILHDLAAGKTYSPQTRKAAFREMTNRALLKEMAKRFTENIKHISPQDVKGVNNQAALAYIAINGTSSHSAGAAEEKITDPKMCYYAAMCSEWKLGSILRKIKTFTDAEVLADIAENAAIIDTKRAAKERLEEICATRT